MNNREEEKAVLSISIGDTGVWLKEDERIDEAPIASLCNAATIALHIFLARLGNSLLDDNSTEGLAISNTLLETAHAVADLACIQSDILGTSPEEIMQRRKEGYYSRMIKRNEDYDRLLKEVDELKDKCHKQEITIKSLMDALNKEGNDDGSRV